MANVNKYHIIGRLGKDPECKTFANGGKVANFSLCTNNKKKNPQSGEWEDDPMWIDCAAFNREKGMKLADMIEQYVRKGQQIYIEGHLVEDKWEKDGVKHRKHKVVVDQFQFLESKKDGSGGGKTSSSDQGDAYEPPQEGTPSQAKPSPPSDGDIPF